MNPVESQMLAYIERRLAEGALSVPSSEILDAVVPADHPELRERPPYRYGLERLHRRHVINAVDDHTGKLHYFIGNYPSAELLHSLELCQNQTSTPNNIVARDMHTNLKWSGLVVAALVIAVIPTRLSSHEVAIGFPFTWHARRQIVTNGGQQPHSFSALLLISDIAIALLALAVAIRLFRIKRE